MARFDVRTSSFASQAIINVQLLIFTCELKMSLALLLKVLFICAQKKHVKRDAFWVERDLKTLLGMVQLPRSLPRANG
jgi:hypothetical protein